MLDFTKYDGDDPIVGSTHYDDHSPLPWSVDDNRKGMEGEVILFDKDGEPVTSFGDMEDNEWVDICNAHTIAHRVNCHDDLLKACEMALAHGSGKEYTWRQVRDVLAAAIEKAKRIS